MTPQMTILCNHFKKGRSITRISAINKFGIMNLAGRLTELKQAGVKIQSDWVMDNGHKIKRYWSK